MKRLWLRVKNKLKDKVCRMMEYRLYVNHELRAKCYSSNGKTFVFVHKNRTTVVYLDNYPQITIDQWMKETLCNEDDGHVMIYKSRYGLFK